MVNGRLIMSCEIGRNSVNTVNRTKLLACAFAASALMLSSSLSAQNAAQPERTSSFKGVLTQLNNSGVAGTFTIEQRGQGQIRIQITATGLEASPGVNVGHIHGLAGNANATCPTLAQDDDGDGFVELAEGLETYGPIILNLGDVDPNDDGIVDYSMTFNLNTSKAFEGAKNKGDLLPLHLREIVLHGLTLDTGEGANGGEANGTAGYKVVLPVACGAIMTDVSAGAMRFRTL